MEAGNDPSFIVLLPIIILIINIIYSIRKSKKESDIFRSKLADKDEEIKSIRKNYTIRSNNLESEKNELLNKYSSIINTEKHAAELIDEAEEKSASIKDTALKLVSDAEIEALHIRQQSKELRSEAQGYLKNAKEKAEKIKIDARSEASTIINFAESKAKEIAGDAFEARAKADTYEKAIRAMRNTIDGYKDDYIIPNHSVLDDLADEFSHKEAGEELKSARNRVRNMVKDNFAGTCDYAEINRRTYAIHFVVDAFNGKVDSALAKVKHDNFGKIKQEIIDAFALVNFNGTPFRNARINQEYLDARLTELKWAVATYELRKIEREEQAEIKAQIREEERAIREMEKARKEAEKEERLIQKALEKARSELTHANEEQKSLYEAQLAELELKLKEAEDKGQRALSMAQQTRRGHVYVISNIGSFGEEVFKIGMTRRLEPMDRVKELGDASVPFSFDVHAMIYSDDAPTLEKELHKRFNLQSVNKVNPRKEFFKTTITEIKQAVEKIGVSDVYWTLKADASEYRESLAIEKEYEKEVA
ncbi:DUF4041 domain-containing protein [Photobacterium leiognathi]|uniref:DUF4041 domain-containing protein n=1 Tax=Photobacterium leiognathi TaxID=553611 RepID=UPI001EE146E4|nr:DUF4041 domain-containing protein [Photobacterium leiognathi]MCG3886481.1 DUF4041 domain-containing protein [Photobacterium leiognathi]